MNTKPNAIRDRLDAVRQSGLDLNAGWRFNDFYLFTLHHRHLALGQDRQVTELMRVLQDGCACGDNRLLGVQTIAELMGVNAVRFHNATVMYGWRLALVALEPAALTVVEVDVLTEPEGVPPETALVAAAPELLKPATAFLTVPTPPSANG